MSFNGSGTFVINSTGQPVVANTVISSTVFNALTADLATGLSTCITKDGQTTPTANIPMGTFKFTGLGNGSAATDSATLGQVQASTTKLVTVSGTDTITGTMTPALTAYAAGQMFYFVAGATNTGAVTLNIDGLGAKSVTRHGSVALVSGDILSGEVCVVVYDGTRFQLLNPASYTNLGVTGNLTLSGGTANGVAYLNASKVVTSGSALVFDGTNLGIGTASPVFGSGSGVEVERAGIATLRLENSSASNSFEMYVDSVANGISLRGRDSSPMLFWTGNTERMRLDSSGNLGIGTASPAARLQVKSSAAQAVNIEGTTARGGGNIFAAFLDPTGRKGYFGYGSASDDGFYLYNEMNAPMVFATNNTERMRLDASGNLGIGTASPSVRLHVEGNQFRQNDATNTFGYVINTTSSTTTLATLFGGSSFAIQTGASGTNQLFLDSSGNLGIGTASPGARLHVAGESRFGLGAEAVRAAIGSAFAAGQGELFTTSTNSMGVGTAGAANLNFYSNSVLRMIIDSNGNVRTNTGALTTTATDGFLYVPTCAGTPTGTPTAITGMAPIVVDTTNNKLYFYSGGQWRDAGP